MSSQDGSNRSQRNRPGSRQQRPNQAPRRQGSTWDVDPAEIDRYLSGRPSRDEGAPRRPDRRSTSGNTADQLSRLQNAVRRQPASAGEDYVEEEPRHRPVQRERYIPEPEQDPTPYYEDDTYGEYGDVEADPYADAGYEEDVWEEPAPPRRQPARRTSSRQPVRQPRQTTRSRAPEPVVYDDDDYDEELYNDDPYLGYEDDRIDRRPVRTPASRQRPQVKITKPNLPKVTIPRSVSESPLLADTPSLIMLGVAVVSVALMSFIVSDRLGLLPETIPTHVGANGEGENIMTRDAVWQIPLLAGMVMLMNVAASWFIARIDQFATRFLLAGGLLVHFIAWVAVFKYLWE